MRPWQAWLRIVLVGAVVGVVVWILTLLIGKYIIEPFTCREIANVAQCVNAASIAGNIAAVLSALLALFALVRMNIAQPVIIAVGSAALLWDLAAWTNGLFWVESIAWAIVLWALSFGLFAWITRYTRMVPAIIVAFIVVVIIRIALIL
jgi:hypothetical protein